MGPMDGPAWASSRWPHARETHAMQAGPPHKGSEQTNLGRQHWAALLLCIAVSAGPAPSSTPSTEAAATRPRRRAPHIP